MFFDESDAALTVCMKMAESDSEYSFSAVKRGTINRNSDSIASGPKVHTSKTLSVSDSSQSHD